MSEGAASLRFAVRLPVVAKYLGQLGVMLALLNLAPLLVAIAHQEWSITLRLLVVEVVLLTLSLPAARLAPPQSLQGNEALVIVCGAFMLTPLLMTLPFTAAGLSFGDALFEAISAITTTGLSTQRHLEAMPQSFLFSRAWMQWYGGLGIVVLSVALLMGHHVTSRRLAEPAGGEGLVTTARTHARRMLLVYLLLTMLGCAVAVPLIGDGMVAVNHVLAAISTGGFSTHDQSLAALASWPQRLLIMGIAWCGAVPLALYYQALHGGWRQALRDGELWLLSGLIVLLTLLLYLLTPSAAGDALLHSFTLAISAQSTTGFSSGDITLLAPTAKLLLVVAMFVGGGIGSTAGGIKLLRLILLFKLVQLLLRRSAAPAHAVIQPRLGGRQLSDDELLRALLLILLFALVVGVSWLLFVSYGYAPLDALLEVTSATATVGLSTGITSHDMPPLLKTVLALDMLLGRLEIVALLVLCYPPTWFGKRLEGA
ncbi:MAG TPA: potassium transporter TrkG [Gammaproteobacteria bacterium]